MSPPVQARSHPVGIIFVDATCSIAVSDNSAPSTSFQDFLSQLAVISGSVAHKLDGLPHQRVRGQGFTLDEGGWWFRFVKNTDGRSDLLEKAPWKLLDCEYGYENMLAEITLGLKWKDGWIEVQHDLQKKRDDARVNHHDASDLSCKQANLQLPTQIEIQDFVRDTEDDDNSVFLTAADLIPNARGTHNSFSALNTVKETVRAGYDSRITSYEFDQVNTDGLKAYGSNVPADGGPGPSVDVREQAQRLEMPYVGPLIVSSPVYGVIPDSPPSSPATPQTKATAVVTDDPREDEITPKASFAETTEPTKVGRALLPAYVATTPPPRSTQSTPFPETAFQPSYPTFSRTHSDPNHIYQQPPRSSGVAFPLRSEDQSHQQRDGGRGGMPTFTRRPRPFPAQIGTPPPQQMLKERNMYQSQYHGQNDAFQYQGLGGETEWQQAIPSKRYVTQEPLQQMQPPRYQFGFRNEAEQQNFDNHTMPITISQSVKHAWDASHTANRMEMSDAQEWGYSKENSSTASAGLPDNNVGQIGYGGYAKAGRGYSGYFSDRDRGRGRDRARGNSHGYRRGDPVRESYDRARDSHSYGQGNKMGDKDGAEHSRDTNGWTQDTVSYGRERKSSWGWPKNQRVTANHFAGLRRGGFHGGRQHDTNDLETHNGSQQDVSMTTYSGYGRGYHSAHPSSVIHRQNTHVVPQRSQYEMMPPLRTLPEQYEHTDARNAHTMQLASTSPGRNQSSTYPSPERKADLGNNLAFQTPSAPHRNAEQPDPYSASQKSTGNRMDLDPRATPFVYSQAPGNVKHDVAATPTHNNSTGSSTATITAAAPKSNSSSTNTIPGHAVDKDKNKKQRGQAQTQTETNSQGAYPAGRTTKKKTKTNNKTNNNNNKPNDNHRNQKAAKG